MPLKDSLRCAEPTPASRRASLAAAGKQKGRVSRSISYTEFWELLKLKKVRAGGPTLYTTSPPCDARAPLAAAEPAQAKENVVES